MEDLVTVTVDGMQLRVPKGTLLWEACKANGIDIPIFCYHTKLGPVGACRTCLVEQEGVAKGPITACSTPVSDGMVIRTKSAIAQRAQRGIFEFLLANHPLDCPICDKGGECPLQDQTFSYGPGTSRYVEPKRHHVKPIVLGPTIALDRERCVLCWRCVRFCAEVAEDKSIVLLDRGDHTVVGTFQDKPYVSNFSGNVTELCPVGALTSRKQRFNFRPWELQNRPSICPHCPMGCNINVSVRKGDEVIRFLSRDNPDVDDSWLCDRGRYGYEFINSPERLQSPLIRREQGFVQVSWSEALDHIARRLGTIVKEHGPEVVAGVASPRLTNEDLYVFRRFMTETIGTHHIDHFPRPQFTMTSAQQAVQGRLDDAVMAIADLGKAKTILLLGANPSLREPVMELRIRQAVNQHGARLVVLGSGEIPLSSKAHMSIQVGPAEFATTVSALADAVAGRAAGAGGSTGDAVATVASEFLTDGPIAVLYDDSFPGVMDAGSALEALGGLLDAFGPGRNVGVIPMLDDCNSMGARDLDILPQNPLGGSWGPSVVTRLLQPGRHTRAAFLLGADLAAEVDGMAERLTAIDFLVVQELKMTQTASLAEVVLPAASSAEKRGTFTNTERRVQALTETVPPPGIARSDWSILVDLSQYFDVPLDYIRPEAIWEDIRSQVGRYRSLSSFDIGPRGARAAVPQLV